MTIGTQGSLRFASVAKQTGRFGALALLLSLYTLGGCTDEVDVDSGFETAQPVVDAWLTDESREQTVYLWQTQDYFANAAPPPLTGAEVRLAVAPRNGGDTTEHLFVEEGDGRYVWRPTADAQRLGTVDHRVTLLVSATVDGQQRAYRATSRFKRVPPIDSIAVNVEEGLIGVDDGLYAQVYARDFAGVGDRYLIRSTINDTLLNRPGELNLAADAAFDGGTASDGIPFILPIRFGVNKLDDDGAPVALVPGDRVEVEVWSLTEEAFQFLANAQEQILNADNGLFTVPVVSTDGNVRALGDYPAPLGMLSVSAVSRLATEVE